MGIYPFRALFLGVSCPPWRHSARCVQRKTALKHTRYSVDVKFDLLSSTFCGKVEGSTIGLFRKWHGAKGPCQKSASWIAATLFARPSAMGRTRRHLRKGRECGLMHVRQTYKRSSRSGYSTSMPAAGDVIGLDRRKEPTPAIQPDRFEAKPFASPATAATCSVQLAPACPQPMRDRRRLERPV